MALYENDREDLLRDGRTMVVRGECEMNGTKVLVGFRDRGQMSLYCGPDPVFQFNANGQLRRTFFEGKRYSAANGHLFELRRHASGGRFHLNQVSISSREIMRIQTSLEEWIHGVQRQLERPIHTWRVIGEAPAQFQRRVSHWIDIYGGRIHVADAPNA